ncbi:MAG: penicillin-binding protein 1C [Halanaerobiales bacterium]|nr:penicillin-binding protein 1C [Halanaerobiales bacterium]
MKKRKVIIALIVGVVILGGGWLVRLPSPLFEADYSTVVLDEKGRFLRVFINQKEQWILPPDQAEIPVKLKEAVLNYEDQRYYRHPGVDPLALGRALYQNLRELERVSGGSTITMQLARLVGARERTIKNKLIEMIQALLLELQYSKEEILKLYLTHAPYGGNIIGYQTASYRYFGKSPAELSWGEAATLAVLPNSPALINPDRNRTGLQVKRNKLLQQLYQRGVITQETYQLARAETVPAGQLPFPLAAPQLTVRLKSQSQQAVIRTTISRDLQWQVQRITRDYMELMVEQGAHNCALLLAETASGEVKAYLGSHDFFDHRNSGQIDGVQMARSTGSILKPFLYGLAIEQGLILPDSQLPDIPVSYGAYTPYNYSESFQGVVRAREALLASLNAPAVNLLAQYGVTRFYHFLQEGGISTLFRTAEGYGLPLILGGAEASLWEVAALYRGLGNYGFFSGLQLLQEPTAPPGKSLLSPGSAYLILDILKDLNRPGLEYYWQDYAAKWKIAWKTGTSYGNRDAWAVGVSPQWTIAVWVGNFDGRESPVLTGLGAAAPLLFRVFNALEKDYYGNWFERPADLKKIRVSARTGFRLSKQQAGMVEVDAPAGALPLRYSPYERVVYLTLSGKEEVCSLCWERDDLQEVLQVVYPPEVIEYLKRRGQAVYTLPPHRRSCPMVNPTNPIEFVYPQPGSKILIPRGLNGEYQKVRFSVAHSKKNSRLFWYLDDRYLGETIDLHQQAITLANGYHKLHVLDQEGHYREINFYSERKE